MGAYEAAVFPAVFVFGGTGVYHRPQLSQLPGCPDGQCFNGDRSDSRTVLETTMEYADMLHASKIDIKSDEMIKIKYDERAYDDFIKKYIICEKKKDKSNGQLIIDFLNRLSRRL